MEEIDLVERAFESWDWKLTGIRKTSTSGRYSCEVDGFIELEPFLEEQYTLMYCDDLCVEMVGFRDGRVLVEVEGFK